MSSIEARLQAAQVELRRMNGTMAVLLKQLESAETLLARVQEMMALLGGESLPDGLRKAAVVMERLCQDWRQRQEGITL